jgi:hypothetical protein
MSASAPLILAVSQPMNVLPLGAANFGRVLEVFGELTFEQKLLALGLLMLAFALILRALGFWDHGHTHDGA